MGVQGYLSLYTVLIGWQCYDDLFQILTQLGLVLLPFGFIALRAFGQPFLSMGAKDAAVIGTRRLIWGLFSAVFMFFFAAVPMVRLAPQVLHYRPHCATHAKVAVPGDTGTTYDDLLPIPNHVKVPMIFYLVMAISNGITNSAEDAISCPTVDLRVLQNQLDLTVIKNPATKKMVARFYNECYLPAYTQLLQDDQDGHDQTAIQNALKKYGVNDVGWIGSEIFQILPGFYDHFSAKSPVVGFPYSSQGINNQINGQTGTPSWGAPTCLNWWQNQTVGLRVTLANEFSKKLKSLLIEITKSNKGENIAEDAAIRTVIEKGGDSFLSPGFYTEQDNQSGVDNFVAKYASKVMIDVYAVKEYPKIQILKNALPVVQAMILAAFCMLLAIALPLSGYSLSFVVTASVFMFALIFCSYLWHWVSFFDQFLLQALYGSSTKNEGVGRLINNLAVSALNPEENLVNMTISTFYIGLPLLFLSVAAWCGHQVNGAMSLGGIDSIATRAGQQKLLK